MKFCSQLEVGVLVRRYKRFLADVRLPNGQVVTAHCANPGSMRTCFRDGGRVWLSRSANKKRKLPLTWELSDLGGELVYVNPARANDIVIEAVKASRVPELAGYDVLRREVAYGANSRIDFVLFGHQTCHVEVKNVTLGLEAGRAAFPDSVTIRGKKHLEELSDLACSGERAVMFFCLSRANGKSVEPADAIDPAYGRALRLARGCGVELLAYATRISTEGVWLSHRVPVRLP